MRFLAILFLALMIQCKTEQNPISNQAIQQEDIIGTWIGTHSNIISCNNSSGNQIIDTIIYESIYKIYPESISICRSNVIKTNCAPIPLPTCDLPSHNQWFWELKSESLHVYYYNAFDTTLIYDLNISRYSVNSLIFKADSFSDTCEKQ